MCERTLRQISDSQIEHIVAKAEASIYSMSSGNRNAVRGVIENAVRHALQVVDSQLAPPKF